MDCQGAIRDSDVIDGLTTRFLRIYGMWKVINDYRTTGKKNIIIKLHIFGTILIAMPYAIFQVQSFFTIKFDIPKATFLAFYALAALSMCYRMVIFWFHLDTVCRLYNLVRKDFLNIPRNMRDNVRELYIKTNRTFNITCGMVFIWFSGIQFLFIAFPKVPVDYVQHHTGSMAAVKTGRKKMLSGWYPVPMDKYPYYQIIFAYEILCVVWSSLTNVYFCTVYQLLMCVSVQFTVLGSRISNLKFDSVNISLSGSCTNRNLRSNRNIYKELLQVLQDHQKLLRFTDDLKGLYNPLVTTITLGIGILVLIVGGSMIVFGKMSDPSFLFQIFQIFSFQFIEVSLFCFGSSRIDTASSDLHFAVYCSDWYKADVKFRKAALMLMIRTTKSSAINTFAMDPINLETLSAIVQSTYSAVCLMSGMVK